MSESWLVELMQSVGMVHECLNAFSLYISNGVNEAQEDTSFVSQPGVEQSILLESGLVRSIVSRVICVNIIKKKITRSIFETVIILLACVSVTILCLKLSVFSQLLQLDPNLIDEFV